MVFYSPTALSFLIFFPLSFLIFVLCSLFSLCGSWSVVLITGLCLSPISLLSVTRSLYSVCNIASSSPISLLFGHCLRFALPLAVASDSLSHSPSSVQIYDYLSLTPWVPICRLCICTGVPIWAYFGGFVIWFWVVGLWFGFGWVWFMVDRWWWVCW